MTQDPHTSAGLTARTTGFRSFLRLITFLGPYRGRVFLSCLLAITVMGFQLTIPYLTGVVINDVDKGRTDQIPHDVGLLIGAALIVAVLWFFRRVVAGTISLGLEKHLRDRLFDHLSRQSFAFFDKHQTGQLLSRVTVDVTQVRFFLGYGLIYFFTHILTLITVPIIVTVIEPRMSLVVYAMMPLVLFVSIRYSRRSHPVLKEVQQREADVTTAAEENIIGARVVRAFGQEVHETERFRLLTDGIVGKEREALWLSATYKPLYTVIPNIALAVLVVLAGQAINRGSIEIGDFFAFYLYMLMLVNPLRIIGNLVSRAQRATASGERLFELFDTHEELEQREDPLPMPDAPGGYEIAFDHVGFRYGDGQPVLNNLSLTIPAGQTVALLGATGSGKTTLTAMISRLYDPHEGTVRMNGVDVRDLPLEQVRRSVGIVDQEPFLFSATVAENIRFGDPDASDGQVRAAARAAQADEFIVKLPQGYDTLIGERGLTLSGGQRQRLAIARALVGDPRVLVLDDATASVDSRVEAMITEALGGVARGRTTVLIAHRPSTISLADHIVILDNGAIIDQGSHDELIERSDMYRAIHTQQGTPKRREFLIDEAVRT